MKETFTTTKHRDFLEALIAGDRPSCSEYAWQYFEQTRSIQELYEEVFKTSLYDIGKLWEYSQICVAEEHLAAAIVEAILNEFYQKIAAIEKTDKRIILSCVEDEVHKIGLKMISDVFEMNGWYSYFLGANTPTKDLIGFTRVIKPDLVGISMSVHYQIPVFKDIIQRIRKEFPELPVLVGGQAFQNGGKEVLEQYDKVYYKPNLKSTQLFIEERMQNE